MVIFAQAPSHELVFELQQHTIPEKTTFIMKIYDFENQDIV